MIKPVIDIQYNGGVPESVKIAIYETTKDYCRSIKHMAPVIDSINITFEITNDRPEQQN